MAIFVDAGKVVPRKADLDFTKFEVSYGLGFRFKLNEAYFMRIDLAAGREGFRFMWTFSDRGPDRFLWERARFERGRS